MGYTSIYLESGSHSAQIPTTIQSKSKTVKMPTVPSIEKDYRVKEYSQYLTQYALS